jgi:hypothetical protein
MLTLLLLVDDVTRWLAGWMLFIHTQKKETFRLE